MTGRDENETTEGISDEQLPDDVRPGEDNPLAEGPTDDEEETLDTGAAPGADS